MHGGIYRCTGIYFFKSANMPICGISVHLCRIVLPLPAHCSRILPMVLPSHCMDDGFLIYCSYLNYLESRPDNI